MQRDKNKGQDIEIFPDFVYKVPPRQQGLTLLKRRLDQVFQIVFSSRFSSDENIQKSMLARYALEDEVEFYKRYVDFGFHISEKFAVAQAFKSLANFDSGLVVGCGAGREVFAFEEMKSSVDWLAIDLCPQMIEVAKELAQNKGSRAEIRCKSISQVDGPFDFIWVTAILESHIQGRANRIDFFRCLKELTTSESVICMTPQFRQLTRRHMYYWGSQLLRLRWLGLGKWEPGDSVQAQLGCHTDDQSLVFCHYYPSHKEFKKELNIAGLDGDLVDSSATNVWMIRHRK